VYYNYAAGGFLSKKLRNRLHSNEVDFYSKKVHFLSHPLGDLDRCHTCDKVASVTGRIARCVVARRTVARLVFGTERCSILCDFDARQSRAPKSQV